jgi:uncharacterized membrane protein
MHAKAATPYAEPPLPQPAPLGPAETLSGAPDAPFFQATVRPHRSLSRKGIFIVIGCMLLGSLAVTCLMVLLGAWPVIGFNGADIALAVFLMWLNIRAARAVEIISLRSEALDIYRTDIRGRQEHISLAPYWLNIILEERHGTVPKLLLGSRGARTEIARQLGETEKRDLAAALTRALNHWRNPSFDNPQLWD